MSEDKKNKVPIAANKATVGVYICACGGNISDHVDVEAVRDRVQKLPEVAVARTGMFMCSDPGQEMIMQDLKSGAIQHVVVASCAPSLHETTFRGAIARAGGNPYLYDHANIREQVSWVHHGDKATDKATVLVSMAVAKAKQLTALAPIRVPARRHATVIGGGIAGMRAALDLAERGIEVVLIEKSPFLGGQLAQLNRIAPTGQQAADLICELARPVLHHARIQVRTCAVVDSFDGYVGNFKIGLTQTPPQPDLSPEKLEKIAACTPADAPFIPMGGVFGQALPPFEKRSTIETGVVVLATGFRPYTPGLGEYGYGTLKEVVTLHALIRSMAETPSTGDRLAFNGRPIRSLAMIHCVGSRQIPGIHPENEQGYLNEYCSRTCCSTTLDTAAWIRKTHPQTQVYEFYRDIRTYGRGQEELYQEAARQGVVFFRFEAQSPPEVLPSQDPAADWPLNVTVCDTLTFGEQISAPVDLVVLVTGIEANPISDLVKMMKLPVGTDRFLLEVHPKLRPVELPVSGLLLAGTCQAPMDVGEACNAAGAAAVKGAALLGRGYVELDPYVAEVDLEKCTGHGACVSACLRPGALTVVAIEKNGRTVKRAHVMPALCLGCGACVAVCPQNAIDIAGWTLRQYEAMVDQIVAEQITPSDLFGVVANSGGQTKG